MAFDPATALLDVGSKLIDRFWPDPTKAAEAKLELFKAQQAGELKEQEQVFELAKGQIEVNKIEAANSSLFVSGWRPFVGWTCGFGLVYAFIVRPILAWGSGYWNIPLPPDLDLGTLLPLLGGLLGLGGLRTFEKINGVARS